MIGVPPNLADGDTVVAFGGRLMTTSERGAGLRVTVPSILSIAGSLTAPRTITVPDADVTLYAGGVTGINKLTIAGAFSNPRTVTFPDATGTLVLAQFSNTFSGSNTFNAAITSTNGRVIKTLSVVSAAGTTTLDATDHAFFLTGTTTHTVTLPAAATGRQLFIKNRSTGALTVNRAGADTIDGLTTLSVAAGIGRTLIANATDWGAI